MTFFAIVSFFVIMLSLAALPSASVALVVVRSASHGLRNGVAVAVGIVAGDLIFMGIALLGMSMLALSMGSLFALFKYLGGAYLIWLGIQLVRSKEPISLRVPDTRRSTLFASFAAGLLLTLGDLKAILFYASLFPTLMNVSTLTAWDILILVALTIITVGGVKLAYASTARTIITRWQTRRLSRSTPRLAGCIMIGTGTYVLTKA